MSRIIACLTLSLLLTACSESNIAATTTRSLTTASPGQLTTPPTSTKSITPSSTSVPTIPLTATPTLSPTPSPTSTFTPVPISIESPSPTPTLKVIGERLEAESYSPDGEWVARLWSISVNSERQDVFARLEIERQDNTRKWILETEMVDPWYLRMPLPFQWSNDGESLYLTYRSAVSDGCFGFDDFNGSDLHRLDLRSGRVELLTPRVGGWLALSPDETVLAYIGSRPDRLGILNLESQESKEFELSLERDSHVPIHESDLIWSPDGQFVAYTLQVGVCGVTDGSGNLVEQSHSIIVVDVNTLSETVVISRDLRRFRTIDWIEPDQILLQDSDGASWSLNPQSGGLLPLEGRSD